MDRAVALILAGGQGERLSILAEERAKPAVIFGGKYRVIDFALSNCVNSGIYTVGVLTQYNPRSLNEHIGIGRPWDLDRMEGGVFILQPYVSRGNSDWYRGTCDAVYQNLHFLEDRKADLVLVLAGDHVYQMRYDNMLDFHRAVGADVTVGVVEVPMEEASRYGVVTLDESDRVLEFHEKPQNPKSNLASMGIYVFGKDIMVERLTEDAHRRSSHDFARDIIPHMVGRDRVFGYLFQGYWRDIGTIDAYWEANMDLLVDLPAFNLYEASHPIRTHIANRPPAKFGPRGHVNRSLICDGCIIDGYVEHSILSPGVHVEEGAVVRDSIIFDDTYIERDGVVSRSIIDKEVRVGRGCQIGYGDDDTPNKTEPVNFRSGITIVGKGTRLPSGLRVGRNCKLGPRLKERDFPEQFIPSGETIELNRGMKPLMPFIQ